MIGRKIGSMAGEVEELQEEELGEILPGIGTKARSLLVRILSQPGFDGTLSREDASAIAALERKTTGSLMLELLPLAASFARSSISNFPVGALIRGHSGRLYFGANIEFGGKTLGDTVHAEQSAAANAFMHREEKITELAVTAAPCGLCRQFLWEMCYDSGLQVLTPTHAPAALANLLPDAFGPRDLGLQRAALPVVSQSMRFSGANPDEVAVAALGAAQISYAPYTKAYAGVGIRTSQGKIYSGSYIENAAYNPSVLPLQVALASLTVAGSDPTLIVEACLVEVAETTVGHRATAEAVFSRVAPSAVFNVLVASRER